MKYAIRLWICVFLLWIAAIHCSSKASGFVVVVNSDLPKGDIDEVRITVSREGQPAQTRTAANPEFPLTLGVMSDPGDRVQARATGLRAGVVVVENFATATVQEDDQRMLVLDLCRECQGLGCNGDFVCVTSTTCSAPGVQSSSLPTWTGTAPTAACQPGDRPKRESSLTNEPPPPPVVITPVADAGDAGSEAGPVTVNDGGTPEASPTCAACPARTQCINATTCQIVNPGLCGDTIDVTLGGTFVGPNCGSLTVTDSCDTNNWTLITFATTTLPAGKKLHGTISSPGVVNGFKVFEGGCKDGFRGCTIGQTQSFVVDSNTKFAIGQRGQACAPYTLTLEVR